MAPTHKRIATHIAVSVLKDTQARTDVLNRLRRAEGQIRGIHRMVEEGEDCLKIGQQFAAVRKALTAPTCA